MNLQRFVSDVMTISVDTSGNIANCEPIPFGSYAGGCFFIASGSITSIAPYGAMTLTGTYVPLYDSSNTAVSRTIAASRGYALPDECFGWKFLKLVANAAGSLYVMLKS